MSPTAPDVTNASDITGFFKHPLSEPMCILFLVLFGLSTAMHTWQCVKYRSWWFLPTVVTGMLELLGWSARLWLSKSPLALTPYEIQLVGTIIGPTPLVAANFIVLGKIINRLGPQYSRLSPKLYTILFVSFDCICLAVQGAGGAIAANAVGQLQDPTTGGHIILGGIVAQMAFILLFIGCGIEFFVRVHFRAPARILVVPTTPKCGKLSMRDMNMKYMIAALCFTTVCVLIRAIYRTCELAQGWNGTIITTEIYFNVFDGCMIVLAMYALNIAHPGFLLSPRTSAFGKVYAIHQLLQPGQSKLFLESVATADDDIYDSYKLANISPNNLTTFGFPLVPNIVGRIMLHQNQDFYVLELLNTDCTLSDDIRVQVFSWSGSDRFAVISCGHFKLGSQIRQHVYYLFPAYQYDITYSGRVVRTIIVSDAL